MKLNTGITNSYVTIEMLDNYEFDYGLDMHFCDYKMSFWDNGDGSVGLDVNDGYGDIITLVDKVTMADFEAIQVLTRGFPKRKETKAGEAKNDLTKGEK